MVNYRLKTSSTGMLKVFADYSDTRLAFDYNNPLAAKWDTLVNKNRNLYVNTNFKAYVMGDWKLFAGAAYNYTLENGTYNVDTYMQRDELWQEKITLSKALSKNSEFTAGAEQFQSRHTEGFSTLRRGYSDILTAGFFQENIYLTNRLLLKAGLRWEYSSYLSGIGFSPRGNLSYIFNPVNKLSFDAGVYNEKPEDSFLSQTAGLQFERALNYAVEYNYTPEHRYLRFQAYYKHYQDLVKITTPVYSGFQAFGPPVRITSFNNKGHGYVKGFDVFWRDQYTFSLVEYYISYSYINTKRNYIDFPNSAMPGFVPQHTLNLVAKKFLIDQNLQVSGTYTFSSGRTYFNPAIPVFMNDRTGANHNVSLGISYLPGWFHQYVAINFTASNIFGFNQLYGYRYSYDGARSVPIYPPSKRGFLLGILINIGDDSFHH